MKFVAVALLTAFAWWLYQINFDPPENVTNWIDLPVWWHLAVFGTGAIIGLVIASIVTFVSRKK